MQMVANPQKPDHGQSHCYPKSYSSQSVHPLRPAKGQTGFGQRLWLPTQDDEDPGLPAYCWPYLPERIPTKGLIMTNGSAFPSKPPLIRIPYEKLAEVREGETSKRLHALESHETPATFLRYGDGELPQTPLHPSLWPND